MESVSDPFVIRLNEVQDFDFDEPVEENDEPFVAAVTRMLEVSRRVWGIRDE